MANFKSLSDRCLKYLQILVFTSILLYFGKALFIPLFFGLLTAIITYPVARRLELKGWGKAPAIAVCLLLVALLIGLLLFLFFWQAGVLMKTMPVLVQKTALLLQQLQHKLEQYSGSYGRLLVLHPEQFSDSVVGLLKSSVAATTNLLVILVITPVYTALLLYHRSSLVALLKSLVPEAHRPEVDVVLQQTIHTYYSYITGLIKVYAIVGTLNSIGLLLLGVDNALLFGMLCAVMTIIPYFGIMISSLLPISVVWMQTGNVFYPLGVVAVFAFVQYLEANVIFPRVVGAQIKVSTFAMLVAMVCGGILWGMAGLILFIPFVAIVHIISGHVPSLQLLHRLLGRD
jgi:predicted PurR-regulated permease PerM